MKATFIDVYLSCDASQYDQATGLWTYTYTMTNYLDSNDYLDGFGLSGLKSVVQVDGPAHWLGFYGYEGDSTAVVWRVADSDQPDDGESVPLSSYQIAPGGSESGFVIRSYVGPGLASYYTLPYADVPVDDPDEDTPLPPTLFELGSPGVTTGPVGTPTVGVGGAARRDSISLSVGIPYPNPSAKDAVRLALALPKRAHVVVEIEDIAGRRVRRVLDESVGGGRLVLGWDGRSDDGVRVGSGVYWVRVSVDGRQIGSRKIVLAR